jgi:Flp pilus assembly protein TadD/capsular polysaccharide biosynthesis protein
MAMNGKNQRQQQDHRSRQVSTPTAGSAPDGGAAEAALAAAMRRHRAGRFREAEALYRRILEARPDHPEALHLLGVVMHQTGRSDAAVEFIGKAIALDPGHANAHANLGVALAALGKLDAAATAYRKASALDPNHAEAHYNLGVALAGQGKLDDAVAAYRKAIALEPGHGEAHTNLGTALKDQGKLDEAVASYRKALTCNPNLAEAHSNLGNALYTQERREEAEASFRRAIEIDPRIVNAHYNLGNLLRKRGELAQAEESYRRGLALEPGNSRALNNLGYVLVRQGKVDEAVGSFRTAERLGPRDGKNVAAFRVSLLDEDKAHKGEPYVKHLKDVLVDTAYWSILDGDKVYSHETHGRNLANSPFIRGRTNPDMTKVIAVYPDPEAVIEERCVFVGGDENYSHWIARNLMKLSIIEHDTDLRSLPMLLNADLAPWQSETLQLLGIPRNRRILVNRNSIVKCNDIYVPTMLRNHPRMKMGLDWLRHKFLTGRETPSWESRDRIFVSRRDADKRHIVNEEDLVDRLAEFGFRVVVPGQMPFSEQVKTFSNAGIVVGAHGAGLQNVVFAPLDCRMIEITSTMIEHMNDFRRICHELGQEVVSIVSDSLVPDLARRSADTLIANSDFRVNVEEVVSVVTEIIADSSA